MSHESLWSPYENGLSVSGLNLWLQDRFAFGVQYLEALDVVQTWRKETAYGTLFQAGLEGYIKTQQIKGLMRFIQNEYEKQVDKYGLDDQIEWWAKLAIHQTTLFVHNYSDDPELPLSLIHTSERNVKIPVELPSGRCILLNGYIDGEGDGLLFENKVRGKYDPCTLARCLPFDLQYNYYLMLLYQDTGSLPDKVWYQTNRRPGSWGYKGPKKKKAETQDEYRNRVEEHMTASPEYYFYRYIGRPTLLEFQKFCHATLYPMLEAFLDWYDFKLTQHLGIQEENHVDWMTPYGIYNPFTEDTEEKFREYRLTGSRHGLVKRGQECPRNSSKR
jgi:hypothetical protein